jgi:hypothetical protein
MVRHILDTHGSSVHGIHWIIRPRCPLRAIARRLFDHPQQDRFDSHSFTSGLQEVGFQVVTTHPVMNLYGWFMADRPKA